MPCEKQRPGLSAKERRQYHALIRLLASRLVARNRQRKLSLEQAQAQVINAEVAKAETETRQRQNTKRGALPMPDPLRTLLEEPEKLPVRKRRQS